MPSGFEGQEHKEQPEIQQGKERGYLGGNRSPISLLSRSHKKAARCVPAEHIKGGRISNLRPGGCGQVRQWSGGLPTWTWPHLHVLARTLLGATGSQRKCFRTSSQRVDRRSYRKEQHFSCQQEQHGLEMEWPLGASPRETTPGRRGRRIRSHAP